MKIWKIWLICKFFVPGGREDMWLTLRTLCRYMTEQILQKICQGHFQLSQWTQHAQCPLFVPPHSYATATASIPPNFKCFDIMHKSNIIISLHRTLGSFLTKNNCNWRCTQWEGGSQDQIGCIPCWWGKLSHPALLLWVNTEQDIIQACHIYASLANSTSWQGWLHSTMLLQWTCCNRTILTSISPSVLPSFRISSLSNGIVSTLTH